MRVWGWLSIVFLTSILPAMGQAEDSLRWSAEWCATDADAPVMTLESQGCDWQPLQQPSGLLAAGGGDIWLRLQLLNDRPEPLERWLTLGNHRLQSVTLFEYREGDTVRVQQGGRSLSRALMSPVMRESGAFSLSVAPSESAWYGLKIQSDSLIALHLELWQPETLRRANVSHDGLWLFLLGMSLSLVILALAMSLYSRESGYAYFALGFFGQILVETHFSSALLRTLWPSEWPMPFGIVVVGTMLLVVGGTALVRRVTLPAHHDRRLLRVVMAFAVISVVSLTWSAAFTGSAGTHIWLISGILGYLFAAAACARAWQLGSEAAGYLLGALLLLLIVIGSRVLIIYGQWPVSIATDTYMMLLTVIAGAWLLWSLVRRSIETRHEIEDVKKSAASQLALFARISHELRTPLDTILGNTQLLLRQRDRLPEVAVLKAMLDSGRHLLGMVDELLDYARGVSGALKIEPTATRFDTWLKGLERTGELLAGRNHNRFIACFEGSDGAAARETYQFDAGRLRQVMDNLLVNAACYTRDGRLSLGGRLEAQVINPSRVMLHLYVEDSGCGIAPEDHERIFEPFERLDRTARAGGVGTGMGLPIARQLVTLMGGELTVLSSLGRGARFTVKVPIERSLEGEVVVTTPALTTAAGYQGERRRILVVDDDDHSRQVILRLLESVGFDTCEATGGREAERLLESGGRVDAVLTDQFMPDGDGWWVLWASQKFRPDVPVILLSAALPYEPLGWDRQRSFAATFLRPLNHGELLQRLGDLLDLQWIFETPADPGSAASVARPAKEYLVELQQLVAFGEVTAIREWAQSLPTREPQFAAFADAVEQAVIELDFGRLELLVADT